MTYNSTEWREEEEMKEERMEKIKEREEGGRRIRRRRGSTRWYKNQTGKEGGASLVDVWNVESTALTLKIQLLLGNVHDGKYLVYC